MAGVGVYSIFPLLGNALGIPGNSRIPGKEFDFIEGLSVRKYPSIPPLPLAHDFHFLPFKTGTGENALERLVGVTFKFRIRR